MSNYDNNDVEYLTDNEQRELKDAAFDALRTRHPLDTLNVSDLAELRAIILAVIDDGPRSYIPWKFYESASTSESTANADRLDFVDEIQRRIVAAATPAVKGATTP